MLSSPTVRPDASHAGLRAAESPRNLLHRPGAAAQAPPMPSAAVNQSPDLGRILASDLLATRRTPAVGAAAAAYAGSDDVGPRFLRNLAGGMQGAGPGEVGELLRRARAEVAESANRLQALARASEAPMRAAHHERIAGLAAGLDRLESHYLGGDRVEARSALSHRREMETRLQIQTADGDTLELRLRQTETLRSETRVQARTGAAGASSSTWYATDLRLQVEIEGDLDDAELAAVNAVLAQADGLATRLAAGDFDGALEALGELSMEPAELRSVAVEIDARERLDVAVAQLRESRATPTDPARVEAGPGRATPAHGSPARADSGIAGLFKQLLETIGPPRDAEPGAPSADLSPLSRVLESPDLLGATTAALTAQRLP